MATIRKMRPSDMADVEYVCRMTAGPVCANEPIIGNRIAKMFSTYYVRECYDTCFVLVDDNDKVVGYVLCEPDFKRFVKVYTTKDVPAIFKLDLKSGFKAMSFPFPYSFFGLKYPAHLHIDILPEYQSKGYGAQMIEAVFNELRERKVKGVMLMAGSWNTGAIRFYSRLGFKIFADKLGTVTMVKNLS